MALAALLHGGTAHRHADPVDVGRKTAAVREPGLVAVRWNRRNENEEAEWGTELRAPHHARLV